MKKSFTCNFCKKEFTPKRSRGKFIPKFCTKSCVGHGTKKHKIQLGEAAFNTVYLDYSKSARKRGLVFNLSKEQFRLLTQNNCAYCGINPSTIRGGRNGSFIYNGIDRKDNSKGYEYENCVPCCTECNFMKGAKSYAVFTDWIWRIVNFQNTRPKQQKNITENLQD